MVVVPAFFREKDLGTTFLQSTTPDNNPKPAWHETGKQRKRVVGAPWRAWRKREDLEYRGENRGTEMLWRTSQPSWDIFGDLGPILVDLGPSCPDLRPVLGRSWPILGPSWANLGRSWPILGASSRPKTVIYLCFYSI